MGRILSDLFDSFLESLNLSWPAKFLLSLVVGVPLLVFLGDYYDWF